MFSLPRDLETVEDLPKAFQEQRKPTSGRDSFIHIMAAELHVASVSSQDGGVITRRGVGAWTGPPAPNPRISYGAAVREPTV